MRFFFDRLRLQRNPRGVVSELLELGQDSIHVFNLARDQFEVGWRELHAGEQRQAMGKTILFQRTLLLRYYRQLSCGLSFRTVYNRTNFDTSARRKLRSIHGLINTLVYYGCDEVLNENI